MVQDNANAPSQKIVIVGGVAGGMSSAARLRRLDENLDITVYEKGGYVSFANCGLPYYLGGEIKERERLFVKTPEAIYDRYRINVKVKHEVLSINPDEKTVRVKNLETGEEITDLYDKLILSPGANPIKPPLPGIDNPKIFTLRNIEDTDHIHKFIEDSKPKSVVVVGGGFIGIEMAENLMRRGVKVTIVEMAKQILLPIDYELASKVHKHLVEKGVTIHTNNSVDAFEDSDNRVKSKLHDGHEVESDFVILSIGVRPNSKLAKDAGLELGVKGTIKVNEYLQTSNPDVYAIGDVIEVTHLTTGKPANIALAGPAAKQGRIAANNIVRGNKEIYKGTAGTAIIEAFDLQIASTGAPSGLLDKEGIKYTAVTVHSHDHVGYYPNARPITLKVIFDEETGKIYGAQGVGYSGIDKQIDVLSLAIQNNVIVWDLKEFEHAYAPQFSSAKAPINMIGFIADNIKSGLIKTISWDKVQELDKNEYFILDVRTPEEFATHKIEGSVNIPLDELRDRVNEVPKDKKIVVYCRVGLRGYVGTRIMRQNGFNAYNLDGGLMTYLDAMEGIQYKDIFDESYDEGMQKVYSAAEKGSSNALETVEIDACGMSCPGPIMKLKEKMDTLPAGTVVLAKATDPGFKNDVDAWAKATGNTLLSVEEDKGTIKAKIKKETHGQTTSRVVGENDKTIIVFDNDLDKVIASFIIANGALAMGRKVTMFFTFWGLSVLLKEKSPKGLKKDMVEKAFGAMLPRGSKELKLSQMNMGGMGAKMIRGLMKKKNVGSLEDLIKNAIDNGVRIIACQTSMELMGVKKEELIDGVEIGGVAQYLEATDHASGNLFI